MTSTWIVDIEEDGNPIRRSPDFVEAGWAGQQRAMGIWHAVRLLNEEAPGLDPCRMAYAPAKAAASALVLLCAIDLDDSDNQLPPDKKPRAVRSSTIVIIFDSSVEVNGTVEGFDGISSETLN
ncbi:hypothetical protein HPB47_003267 [Ixodes persulcatus]|uniref:Uncharacterized protein n=1 Tax=Ixodes persulcatus TaxID=34615 RepID=A0AC60PIY2_IXOPE|nr:hypothetical protein HPB47_003267 [Ixodes persulcatus]